MIRQIRRKFIISSMSLITIVLVVLLISINCLNILYTDRVTTSLLQDISILENPYINPSYSSDYLDDKERAIHFTFFLDPSGKIVYQNLDHSAGLKSEEALYIFNNYKREKVIERILNYKCYTRVESTGYTTVVYLDISHELTNISRVFVLSIILGFVSWVLMMWFLAVVAKHYTKPYSLNLERQKQFITDAGHELKTPLAIILANTEALEITSGENKYLTNIKSQIERMTGLTENLLTLSKIDEEAITFKREEVNLKALIEQILTSYEEVISLNKLKVTTNLNSELKKNANPDLIYQLFSILIDNAIKYTPSNGKIILNLEKQGRSALFEITNTSDVKGLDLNKIFDRFYRADKSRNQTIKGFGIGLSAARAIVNGYGGSISASSIDDNQIKFSLII